MAKAKIDIRGKSNAEVIRENEQILEKTQPPQGATSPFDPERAAFAQAAHEYSAAEDKAKEVERALEGLYDTRDEKKKAMIEEKKKFASKVDNVTKGKAEAITATGFALVDAAEPTTALEAPGALSVTTTNVEGALDLAWDKSDGAFNYAVFQRKEGETEARQVKMTSRTRLRVEGLTPGTRYTFHIVAYGPHDTMSPPSSPMTKMAA